MTRILLFILGFLLLATACNNDLTTIGQDMVDNNNYIGEDNMQVISMSTIKIDSFITSCGRYPESYVEKLIMGRYSDEYSGTTTAIPCFQISPASTPTISTTAILDSVTLQFGYGGNMWGDTLYNTQLQRYTLYQLKDLPYLDYDKDWYIYNTRKVELGDSLSTTRFYPLVDNMKFAHFRIPDKMGKDLFERMKYRGTQEGDIYYYSTSGNIPFLNFLKYFKGLAIVPDEQNKCLMSVSPDSVYLKFSYHEGDRNQVIKFPLAQREYQYNRIITELPSRFDSLVKQEATTSFSSAGISVAQGLSGYMVKIELPPIPYYPQYTTIIKAQMEIKPQIYYDNPVTAPKQITVYTTNDLNEISGILYNNSSSQVTGTLYEPTDNIDDKRYIFDMTEYYQQLASVAPLRENQQILLSIPNLTLSYDRMVIKEMPIIKIYYAKYKN